jgi:pimeloyl-ACP methyl ester carboxylesterase
VALEGESTARAPGASGPSGPTTPASLYRSAMRLATDPRTTGLLSAGPRTATFAVRTWARGRRPGDDALPARLSPAVIAQAVLDEVVVAAMKDPGRLPRSVDFVRAGGELRDARAQFEAAGWLERPESYHDAPGPPGAWQLRPARAGGLRYEWLTWSSGYEPHDGEPGRDRWLDHRANRVAHAWLLRHRRRDGPWLVCLHGFGMGAPRLDLRAFRATALYRLGLNLALLVLPLHGPRQTGPRSGDGLMSIDLIDSVHGLAQAAWDARRLLAWLRLHDADHIGAYGLSLGGHVAAMLASLEGELSCTIAGIPATDIPGLYRHHSPAGIRREAHRHHLYEDASAVHRVVSPLALEPRVARERRFIFAELGDRMSTASQAHRLWLHWDRPTISWYPGGHVGFFWSRQVGAFLLEALEQTGLLAPRAA